MKGLSSMCLCFLIFAGPSFCQSSSKPKRHNCTESNESVFSSDGDTAPRFVVNCENMGIGDTELEAVVRSLPSTVEVLNLAHNFLGKLNMTLFRRLLNLELLNVSENSITEVFGNQRELPLSLATIDYSSNKLKCLTPNMVPLRIRRLLLSNNAINEIANGTFVYGKTGYNLLVLDLSHNRMKRLIDFENGILETPQLLYLNLSHNSLASYFSNEAKLMVGFSRLENLEILDLSNNDIDQIFAGDLQNLGRLRFLDLSHNDLPDFDAFSFNVLTLKRNGHAYMWQHWNYKWWLLPGPGLRNLRKLDISHNKIRKIDLQLIHEFGKLESVDFSDNWFHCDGELYFAVSIMKKHVFVNATFVDINGDRYVCFSPPEVKNQPIYTFNCTGGCWNVYQDLQRRYELAQGYPKIEEPEELTAPSIALIVATAVFVLLILLVFLWALRNGLVHRCCHVCLTAMSTAPHRNPRLGGNTNTMTARFAQLDQLEAETEVA